MSVSTRIVDDNPRSLYIGDLIEGTDAIRQVSAGNAEEIKDEEPVPREPKK